jgi:hypothetical protein
MTPNPVLARKYLKELKIAKANYIKRTANLMYKLLA